MQYHLLSFHGYIFTFKFFVVWLEWVIVLAWRHMETYFKFDFAPICLQGLPCYYLSSRATLLLSVFKDYRVIICLQGLPCYYLSSRATLLLSFPVLFVTPYTKSSQNIQGNKWYCNNSMNIFFFIYFSSNRPRAGPGVERIGLQQR